MLLFMLPIITVYQELCRANHELKEYEEKFSTHKIGNLPIILLMWRWLSKQQAAELDLSSFEALLEHLFELSQKGEKVDDTSFEASRQFVKTQVITDWSSVGQWLNKLIALDTAAYGFYLLKASYVLPLLIPELAQNEGVEQGGFHHLDVLNHSLEALRQLLIHQPEASLALRWASLLHDLGKGPSLSQNELGQRSFVGHDKLGAQIIVSLFRRLEYPPQMTHRTEQLVHYHMLPLPKNPKEAERFVRRREDLLPDLLYLMIADREAARGRLSSEASRRAYRLAVARVIEAQQPVTPKEALLSGHEIMALLELEPGPQVGKALAFIEQAEQAGDINSKAEAEAALRHFALQQGWILQ